MHEEGYLPIEYNKSTNGYLQTELSIASYRLLKTLFKYTFSAKSWTS